VKEKLMRRTSRKISTQKDRSERKIGSSGIIKQQKSSNKLSPGNGNDKNPSKGAGLTKDSSILSIKKQYLKSNGLCNVTFKLP